MRITKSITLDTEAYDVWEVEFEAKKLNFSLWICEKLKEISPQIDDINFEQQKELFKLKQQGIKEEKKKLKEKEREIEQINAQKQVEIAEKQVEMKEIKEIMRKILKKKENYDINIEKYDNGSALTGRIDEEVEKIYESYTEVNPYSNKSNKDEMTILEYMRPSKDGIHLGYNLGYVSDDFWEEFE